jgi:hypothetical protein
MGSHKSAGQEIATSYKGFVFLIRGSVRSGEDAEPLKTDQVRIGRLRQSRRAGFAGTASPA